MVLVTFYIPYSACLFFALCF